MPKFHALKAFFTVVLLSSYLWADVEQDLKICQSYELHGELSSDLKKEPIITTLAESGLKVELIIVPNEETSLDQISLKGQSVLAKALVLEKISARYYKAKVYNLKLDQPAGFGADKNAFKAKKIVKQISETCPSK